MGSFCTPHLLVQTYWQFSCKVLIWICSIHFLTWWISKDVRVTARKRRHAKFKIMNMYIWSCLKAYTMTDVSLCWVTTLLEGFWLNYRLQFIKQLMVIQCSNMHVFHCSGRLELLCYSLQGYGHDFSWNISNFVFIFLTFNVLNLNIVLCLNIIFMSKRVTSKMQSWLILCNVNKIHMPCFCLREPIKISLYLFFSIFWNLNMNTNSFEIFFISFKKFEIQVFFFFSVHYQ